MNVFALGIVTFALSAGDYFPPADPKAGAMRDLMLIYLDKDSWSQADFLPYVAYLGKDRLRRPQDWFYDSYLFLAYGGAPSGATYIDGASNKADWEYYFDRLLFRKDRSLAALDACIADVERTLGPHGPVPVILMIPYPSVKQKDFGDVDGDGRSEDLSRPADRLKAVRWCVDQMLRRWQASRLPRLKLWGFYWMNEGIGPGDEAIVRATADDVHGRGYGLHWIPYYHAPGCDKLAALGIDFAVLQPNYAFMEESGRRAEEQRLSDTAAQARRYHMGIEIEMTTIAGRRQRENLWDYLTHGRDEFDGYMRRAVHAYYQGESTIAKLASSSVRADRDLYEALYQFAKGKFQGQRERLAAGCRYRCQGQLATGYPDDGRKLTDGRFAGDPSNANRLVGLSGESPRIELDLGQVRKIASVALRVVTRGTAPDGLPAQAACPKWFDVSVSTTGRDWRPAGRGYRWYATPGERITAGEMAAEFAPCDARHVSIAIHQAADSMTLADELLVEPAASLTENAACRLSPAPAGGDVSGSSLVDSRYQRPGASPDRVTAWRPGQAACVEVELADPRHLGLVRVHSPQPEAIARLDVLARVDGLPDWRSIGAAARFGSFFDLNAEAAFTGQLRLVATPVPGKPVVLDEIELYPAENLAAGKHYELSPIHPEKYGDPDRTRLTDGQISQRGFGDGRMVGWHDQSVEVAIDLGQSRMIDAVRVHTEGGGCGAVRFPPRVDILVSSDGRAWSWAGTIDRPPQELLLDRPADHARLQLGWMNGSLTPVPARFVMLRCAPNGWTMLSEVEVLAAGKNVAAGRAYHLRPAPSSSAPYADTTGKLTDGQYSSGGFSRAVGWNQGRPTVKLDLGLPVSVGEVAAHVVGGGPGGVYFPKRLSVSTSLDGSHWEPEQATTQSPPQTGHDQAWATLRVRFPPRPGRYVRLEFQPYGWLMLDEVEVYGRN